MSDFSRPSYGTCKGCGSRFIPDEGECCYTCEECSECGPEVGITHDDHELCPEHWPKCTVCGEKLDDKISEFCGIHSEEDI